MGEGDHPKGGGGGAPRNALGAAHGTETRHKALESLDLEAGTAPKPAPLAGEARSAGAAEAGADLMS